MLPFTRNAFDPMDFTPMVLDAIPGIERRTTPGFELALSVVFTSGIQHYAETPEGMSKAPAYVKQFLRGVPSVWEDSQFIAGFPGREVVMARLAGGKWYVAGINGEGKGKALTLDLSGVPVASSGELITDGGGDGLGFRRETVEVGQDGKVKVTLQPNGGFVLVIGQK